MIEENTPAPDLFEGMTAISAVLDPAIRAFNDRRVLSVFVDKTRMDKKARELGFLRHRAEELGFEITPVHPDDLDHLTSGKTHGGIVAVCSDRTIPLLSESMDQIKENGFYGKARIATYSGTNAMYELATSTHSRDRQMYLEYCRFITENPLRKK